MLSEFIPSRHSYSAFHLAVEQIHQRSVLFGPLVVYSPLTRSTDYIFTFFVLRTNEGMAYYKHRLSFSKKRFLTMQVRSLQSVKKQVVTGSIGQSRRLPTVLSYLILVLTLF